MWKNNRIPWSYSNESSSRKSRSSGKQPKRRAIRAQKRAPPPKSDGQMWLPSAAGVINTDPQAFDKISVDDEQKNTIKRGKSIKLEAATYQKTRFDAGQQSQAAAVADAVVSQRSLAQVPLMKKQAKRAINSTRSSGRAICRQKSGPRVGGRKHGRDQYFTRKRGKTSRRGGQVPMTTTNLVKDKTSQKGAGASRPTSVLDSCLSPWSSSHHCAFDWPNIQISRPVARAQRPGADGVSPAPTAEFPPPQAQKERPRATIKAEMLQSGPFG